MRLSEERMQRQKEQRNSVTSTFKEKSREPGRESKNVLRVVFILVSGQHFKKQ